MRRGTQNVDGKTGCVSYSKRRWRQWKSIDCGIVIALLSTYSCVSVSLIGLVRACDLNMMWRINLHTRREYRELAHKIEITMSCVNLDKIVNESTLVELREAHLIINRISFKSISEMFKCCRDVVPSLDACVAKSNLLFYVIISGHLKRSRKRIHVCEMAHNGCRWLSSAVWEANFCVSAYVCRRNAPETGNSSFATNTNTTPCRCTTLHVLETHKCLPSSTCAPRFHPCIFNAAPASVFIYACNRDDTDDNSFLVHFTCNFFQ